MVRLSPEEIDQQQVLLATHRRTLAHLLRQATHFSAGHLPAHIANGIDETRDEIARIKAVLHDAGATVADHVDDRPRPSVQSTGRSKTEQRNRQAMLKRVRTIWIEGLLDQSLANELRIALDLTEQPDAVALPLNALVQELRHPPRPLPNGTPIITVFELLGGALLILGAPGAGKTTLLLELARDLIERAEHDDEHPIPVVFNLSSWAEKRRPLNEWLVEELNTKYDVPRKVAQAWIGADEVLPLLDGLDEVAVEVRDDCMMAINTYREQHGLVPLSVCSRAADYEALSAKLRLQGAIIVQTLTPQQVEAYLERAGEKLAGVRAAVRDDAELRAMLETPLMLSIVTLAYKDKPVEALQMGGTEDQQRRHLFDAYIAAMFGRRGEKIRYSQQQTLHWLSWLAQAMSQRAQTVFNLENLQPEWLSTRTRRFQYVLLDRLLGVLLGGLVGWLVFNLGYRLYYVGLRVALGHGIAIGLAFGLGGIFFGGQNDIEALRQRTVRRLIADALFGGLVFGLLSGLVGVSLDDLRNGFTNGLHQGRVNAEIGGLVGGLLGVLTGRPSLSSRQVIITERLRWVWRDAWKAAMSGLFLGLFIGLIIALSYVEMPLLGNRLLISSLVAYGLVFGLFGALMGVLIGGLRRDTLTAIIQVNEGIIRSANSALNSGLSIALSVGLIYSVVFRWIGFIAINLSGGIVVPLFGDAILSESNTLHFALFFALFFGLAACRREHSSSGMHPPLAGTAVHLCAFVSI